MKALGGSGASEARRSMERPRLREVKRNSTAATSVGRASDESHGGEGKQSLDYPLFIVLNAILFLRPTEVIPALDGLPLYNATIICCLVASFSKIGRSLSLRSLVGRPISLCVLGLLPAVVLSHLSHGSLGGARESFSEFSKVVLYYFLLESTLDTERRLNGFFNWLCVFIAIVASLTTAAYHDWFDLPAFAPHREWATDPESGELYLNARLQAVGIFGNPNDFSRILLVAMALCLFRMNRRHTGLKRWVWGAPPVLFGHALALTQSRGALLALLAGLLAFYCAKYGRKAALPALITFPLILAVFSGRQTEFSTDSGTAQDRIKLWSEGFGLFRRAPLFGVGMNQFVDEVGMAAHNSFLNCYSELGLVGGSLFFGANYFALAGLIVRRKEPLEILKGDLARMGPYLLGILVLYQVGMLTSNRSYSLPTYMILGLVAVFARTREANTTSSRNLTADMFLRMMLISVVFIISLYLFVRLNVHFGGE
jgi:hypothetical protein